MSLTHESAITKPRRGTWMPALGVIVTLLPGLGCASIETQIRHEDEVLRVNREERPTSRTPTLIAKKTGIEEASIGFQLSEQFQCQNVTVPIVHRTRHLERHAKPVMGMHPLVWEFVGGGLLVAAGINGYVNAETLAGEATDLQTGEPKPGNPKTFQIVGIAMAGVGAVLLGLGVIDGIRLRDSEEAVGEVRGSETTETVLCRTHPVANRSARLLLSDKSTLQGTTDAAGKVFFSLHNVPVTTVSTDFSTGTLNVESNTSEISVGFSRFEQQSLISALIHDPTSRAGTALLAEQKRTCREAVQTAERRAIEAKSSVELEQAIAAFDPARITCAEHFSQEDERAAHAVESRLPAMKTKEAEDHCSGALNTLQVALDEESFESLRAKIEAVSTTDCKNISGANERIKKLGDLLRDRELKRQRAEQIASALQVLRATIARADLEESRRTLQKNSELLGAAQNNEDVLEATNAAVQDAVTEVIRTHRKENAALLRMCHARKLYLQLRGREAWKTLRKQLAERYSDEDPLATSAFLEAMEMGRCH